MKQLIFAILFLFCSYQISKANTDSSALKISILTCGVGDELYASFGHTAVRIVDTVNKTDIVYNYGLFDFYDPDFLLKFTKGKLLYYIGKDSYFDFVRSYESDQRSVKEQVLNLPSAEKNKIFNYLENNLKPENKFYKYDFLFDNCATRVRNIFPTTLGKQFHFGKALNTESKITFRTLLNEYVKYNHWPKLGINIALGSKVDKYMSNEEAMFLPDMLLNALQTANYNDQVLVTESTTIVKGIERNNKTINTPMWLMIAILILTILVFFKNKSQQFSKILAFIFLFLSGLLGCLLLFMWFGTDHQTFGNNFNLLWAFPLNLLVAFTLFKPRKWHKKYAVLAIVLLFSALIIHITGIQIMPVTELMAFFLCLLYVYAFLIKNAKQLNDKMVLNTRL